MSVIKEGQPVHEVIIQEGVYTFENIDGGVAEPVVYMIDQFVVGGFYRVHTDARHRREPELARRRVQAARLRDRLPVAGLRRRPRHAAQPLLHLRRGGAPGHARRRARGRGAREPRLGAGGPGGERMKFAFVVDPLDHLKAYKDSSRRDDARGRAARPRGARAARRATMVAARRRGGGARAAASRSRADDDAWYRAGDRGGRARSPTSTS